MILLISEIKQIHKSNFISFWLYDKNYLSAGFSSDLQVELNVLVHTLPVDR